MSQQETNATQRAEQEAFRKNEQQRLEKDRMTEDKRLAEERQQAHDKNQEEIRKDSERRRQTDKDRKEFAKHQEEVRINREESIRAEKLHQEQEQGEEVKPMQSRTPQSQELRDLSNVQKAFERQIKVNAHIEAEYQRAIDKHDHFKGKFEDWHKTNINMTLTRNKVEREKLHQKREGIEKDIEREYRIVREKPKFFDGKGKRAELDQDYQDKLQDKMKELAKGKDEAVKSLDESKNKGQDYRQQEEAVRERVNERLENMRNSRSHDIGHSR